MIENHSLCSKVSEIQNPNLKKYNGNIGEINWTYGTVSLPKRWT